MSHGAINHNHKWQVLVSKEAIKNSGTSATSVARATAGTEDRGTAGQVKTNTGLSKDGDEDKGQQGGPKGLIINPHDPH